VDLRGEHGFRREIPVPEGDLKARSARRRLADVPGRKQAARGGHWTRDVVFSQDERQNVRLGRSHSNGMTATRIRRNTTAPTCSSSRPKAGSRKSMLRHPELRGRGDQLHYRRALVLHQRTRRAGDNLGRTTSHMSRKAFLRLALVLHGAIRIAHAGNIRASRARC